MKPFMRQSPKPLIQENHPLAATSYYVRRTEEKNDEPWCVRGGASPVQFVAIFQYYLLSV